MPYYTESFLGQAGQTARADHVREQLAAIETGFGLVEDDIGKTLRGSDAMAALGNAAARALKFVRFDANGDPELVDAALSWEGDWATATDYAVGALVRYGDYGSIYLCVTAHTSSGSTIHASNFEVLIDLTGINIIENTLKTASFTAVSGGDYMVDSSAGNVTITLPAAPTISDAPINITHVAGSLASGQLITVARNGKLIMGLAEDLSIDSANASISLMFCNDTLGWRLRVLA